MTPILENAAKQRSERRISVRLPLRVRGCDARGFSFEEDTASENLCRGGAAFRTHFDVAIGSNLQIRMPAHARPNRHPETEFETQGRVVHVTEAETNGERVVGVQFTGPRFRRLFRPESAA
jgi:c-di-GMP-binding flagellar brake protein YcgR